ncbi:MAG: sigma-70 family RNA polymerase sigma factor [Alphaproteobacteria bacterium]|nr:sigma-70 family RNA polymerase sigma factor [Alphaproteobacteria bacterium]
MTETGVFDAQVAGGADFKERLIELIPFLRAFARTLCGHRDQADDLCQEALAKAWQSRATFEPGTNLKAWLFMILRNQFYSEKRRAWRQKPWDDATAEQSLVAGGSQHASMALSDVSRAMQLLPNEQREALILVGAGGFAYEEAAKICGCALGTIKSRVARARRTLESALSGTGANPLGARPSVGEAANDILAQLDTLAPADPNHGDRRDG